MLRLPYSASFPLVAGVSIFSGLALAALIHMSVFFVSYPHRFANAAVCSTALSQTTPTGPTTGWYECRSFSGTYLQFTAPIANTPINDLRMLFENVTLTAYILFYSTVFLGPGSSVTVSRSNVGYFMLQGSALETTFLFTEVDTRDAFTYRDFRINNSMFIFENSVLFRASAPYSTTFDFFPSVTMRNSSFIVSNVSVVTGSNKPIFGYQTTGDGPWFVNTSFQFSDSNFTAYQGFAPAPNAVFAGGSLISFVRTRWRVSDLMFRATLDGSSLLLGPTNFVSASATAKTPFIDVTVLRPPPLPLLISLESSIVFGVTVNASIPSRPFTLENAVISLRDSVCPGSGVLTCIFALHVWAATNISFVLSNVTAVSTSGESAVVLRAGAAIRQSTIRFASLVFADRFVVIGGRLLTSGYVNAEPSGGLLAERGTQFVGTPVVVVNSTVAAVFVSAAFTDAASPLLIDGHTGRTVVLDNAYFTNGAVASISDASLTATANLVPPTNVMSGALSAAGTWFAEGSLLDVASSRLASSQRSVLALATIRVDSSSIVRVRGTAMATVSATPDGVAAITEGPLGIEGDLILTSNTYTLAVNPSAKERYALNVTTAGRVVLNGTHRVEVTAAADPGGSVTFTLRRPASSFVPVSSAYPPAEGLRETVLHFTPATVDEASRIGILAVTTVVADAPANAHNYSRGPPLAVGVRPLMPVTVSFANVTSAAVIAVRDAGSQDCLSSALAAPIVVQGIVADSVNAFLPRTLQGMAGDAASLVEWRGLRLRQSMVLGLGSGWAGASVSISDASVGPVGVLIGGEAMGDEAQGGGMQVPRGPAVIAGAIARVRVALAGVSSAGGLWVAASSVRDASFALSACHLNSSLVPVTYGPDAPTAALNVTSFDLVNVSIAVEDKSVLTATGAVSTTGARLSSALRIVPTSSPSASPRHLRLLVAESTLSAARATPAGLVLLGDSAPLDAHTCRVAFRRASLSAPRPSTTISPVALSASFAYDETTSDPPNAPCFVLDAASLWAVPGMDVSVTMRAGGAVSQSFAAVGMPFAVAMEGASVGSLRVGLHNVSDLSIGGAPVGPRPLPAACAAASLPSYTVTLVNSAFNGSVALSFGDYCGPFDVSLESVAVTGAVAVAFASGTVAAPCPAPDTDAAANPSNRRALLLSNTSAGGGVRFVDVAAKGLSAAGVSICPGGPAAVALRVTGGCNLRRGLAAAPTNVSAAPLEAFGLALVAVPLTASVSMEDSAAEGLLVDFAVNGDARPVNGLATLIARLRSDGPIFLRGAMGPNSTVRVADSDVRGSITAALDAACAPPLPSLVTPANMCLVDIEGNSVAAAVSASPTVYALADGSPSSLGRPLVEVGGEVRAGYVGLGVRVRRNTVVVTGTGAWGRSIAIDGLRGCPSTTEARRLADPVGAATLAASAPSEAAAVEAWLASQWPCSCLVTNNTVTSRSGDAARAALSLNVSATGGSRLLVGPSGRWDDPSLEGFGGALALWANVATVGEIEVGVGGHLRPIRKCSSDADREVPAAAVVARNTAGRITAVDLEGSYANEKGQVPTRVSSCNFGTSSEAAVSGVGFTFARCFKTPQCAAFPLGGASAAAYATDTAAMVACASAAVEGRCTTSASVPPPATATSTVTVVHSVSVSALPPASVSATDSFSLVAPQSTSFASSATLSVIKVPTASASPTVPATRTAALPATRSTSPGDTDAAAPSPTADPSSSRGLTGYSNSLSLSGTPDSTLSDLPNRPAETATETGVGLSVSAASDSAGRTHSLISVTPSVHAEDTNPPVPSEPPGKATVETDAGPTPVKDLPIAGAPLSDVIGVIEVAVIAWPDPFLPLAADAVFSVLELSTCAEGSISPHRVLLPLPRNTNSTDNTNSSEAALVEGSAEWAYDLYGNPLHLLVGAVDGAADRGALVSTLIFAAAAAAAVAVRSWLAWRLAVAEAADDYAAAQREAQATPSEVDAESDFADDSDAAEMVRVEGAEVARKAPAPAPRPPAAVPYRLLGVPSVFIGAAAFIARLLVRSGVRLAVFSNDAADIAGGYTAVALAAAYIGHVALATATRPKTLVCRPAAGPKPSWPALVRWHERWVGPACVWQAAAWSGLGVAELAMAAEDPFAAAAEETAGQTSGSKGGSDGRRAARGAVAAWMECYSHYVVPTDTYAWYTAANLFVVLCLRGLAAAATSSSCLPRNVVALCLAAAHVLVLLVLRPVASPARWLIGTASAIVVLACCVLNVANAALWHGAGSDERIGFYNSGDGAGLVRAVVVLGLVGVFFSFLWFTLSVLRAVSNYYHRRCGRPRHDAVPYCNLGDVYKGTVALTLTSLGIPPSAPTITHLHAAAAADETDAVDLGLVGGADYSSDDSAGEDHAALTLPAPPYPLEESDGSHPSAAPPGVATFSNPSSAKSSAESLVSRSASSRASGGVGVAEDEPSSRLASSVSMSDSDLFLPSTPRGGQSASMESLSAGTDLDSSASTI